MTFANAAPADALAISRIFALCWTRQVRAFLPLGCSGATQFIRASIHPLSENRWFVARGERIRAFCEMRRLPDALLLNQIAVLPRFQRHGLAKRLFQHALESLDSKAESEVLLDVFSHNPARSWYANLGFSATGETTWAVVDLLQFSIPGIANRASKAILKLLPQARTLQKTFGFSEIVLSTSSDEYRIGRLGNKLYRCLNASILKDPDALQALRSFEPPRTRILIQAAAGDWLVHPAIEFLWSSIRMKAHSSQVQTNLKKAH